MCRYEDDKDEGEWFLYTGSGGRDLSGNKRVTKVQSFDQTFDKMNKALLLVLRKGTPCPRCPLPQGKCASAVCHSCPSSPSETPSRNIRVRSGGLHSSYAVALRRALHSCQNDSDVMR